MKGKRIGALLAAMLLIGIFCAGCAVKEKTREAGEPAASAKRKEAGPLPEETGVPAEPAVLEEGGGDREEEGLTRMAAVRRKSYRNVAYYTSWSAYARKVFVSDIDASLLTHLNFAFANLKPDGRIEVGDSWVDTEQPMGNDTWETKGVRGHFGQLKKLKKKYPKLKTLISVGGWTWSANFSDVAASAAKRKKFASSAAAFVKKYGFDGVDIDWEFPVEGGDGIKHRGADKENYTKLLKELRTTLDAQGKKDGKTYLVTIAGGPNESFTRNVELKKIMKYVDFINVMTYDYHGGWESVTGHNAPLYVNPKEPTKKAGYSVEVTINAYIRAGVKPQDLNLGLAFYGRGWTGVPNKNHGLFQRGATPSGSGFGRGTWEAGTFDYWDLEKNYIGKKGYKRYYDNASKVPYLFNGSTFITYDDKTSILEKTKFAVKKGLGGIMFWEFSGDKKKVLQKAAADYLGIKTSAAASPAASVSEPPTPAAQERKAAAGEAASQNWKKEAVYTAGDEVTYKKKTYRAKWWTQGETPDASDEWGPWEPAGVSK